MRVLYIYDGDWPTGATRVRKQTVALAAAGHEVLLLARNASRQPREVLEPWMTVRRLPTFPGRALNQALNFPLFFSPVWLAEILGAIRRFRPDRIVVEDLPLAPAGIAAARATGLPLHYDMGEVYPAFLEGLRSVGRASWIDRMLRSPSAAGLLERWVLRRADHTFVVSEESRARAILRGADSARLSIVGNTPGDLESLSSPDWDGPPPPGLDEIGNRPIVLFVGILIFDRGITDAVRAMVEVGCARPEAVLLIVGDGPERPGIEGLVAELGLEDRVKLVGWQPHESLPRYYHSARIGLLPFLDCGQIRYTLANKLFDYMAAGLPFIASDVPPMRRIAEETGGGVLARPADPAELARRILELLALSDEERKEMGAKGARAVREHYNWSQDARRFVEGVERGGPE